MNTTTTHRRFAVRRLLPCLALLVASVSSCAPLNTYSGRPFTPAAVTYNSIDTTADLRAFWLRGANACQLEVRAAELAIKAAESSSAETLAAAGEMYLSAARACQEWLADGALNVISGKKLPAISKELGKMEDSMYDDLIRAERYGANRTAVGRAYYDYARIGLACSSAQRARGREDKAALFRNDALRDMRRAQARGIAEAAAYLRTH